MRYSTFLLATVALFHAAPGRAQAATTTTTATAVFPPGTAPSPQGFTGFKAHSSTSSWQVYKGSASGVASFLGSLGRILTLVPAPRALFPDADSLKTANQSSSPGFWTKKTPPALDGVKLLAGLKAAGYASLSPSAIPAPSGLTTAQLEAFKLMRDQVAAKVKYLYVLRDALGTCAFVGIKGSTTTVMVLSPVATTIDTNDKERVLVSAPAPLVDVRSFLAGFIKT